MHFCKYAVAALFAVTSMPAFSATPIAGLYNTGVDDDGNVLAVGAHDLHYRLDGGLGSRDSGPFAYANNAYNTPGDASYISAFRNGSYGQSATHTYSLVFDLTGLDAATAFISGRFAADDQATIFLNGVSTGFSEVGFSTLTDFFITTGFIAGVNTLTFQLTDTQGPPSALLVDRIEGAAEVAASSDVPEPATWAMFISGFGLIGATMRRKRMAVSFS